MPVSPETEIAAAYGAGRAAAAGALPRSANPFVLDGSSLIQVQWSAWNAGYDDITKDFVAAQAVLNAGGAQGIIFPGFRYGLKKVTVPNASVLNLFTTEVDIVAGVPGYTLKPILVHTVKAPGAYGVASVTAIILGWGTVADNAPAIPAGSVTNLLTAAGAYGSAGFGMGNGQSGFFGIVDLTAQTGKKLALRTTGAGPTGAGGALTVNAFYQLVADSY